MTLQEAKQKIIQFQSLIGKVNERGFDVDCIIPVPSEKNIQIQFLRTYLDSLNIDEALNHYQGEDMEIWAIELKHYQQSGVLFYEKLS